MSLTGALLFPMLVLGAMTWLWKPKHRERFYLLPGMGGRNLRRKQNFILRWTIVAGLFVSAILACILYLLNNHTH